MLTPGVEATAGPLGQGISNAVGMALAEAHLAAVFNRPGHEIINHRTFVMASDGDLMEGVASEAASLAGYLGLGKLVVFYDDNDTSIEGATRALAYNEDVGARFAAYGWHVVKVDDGSNLQMVDVAIHAALAEPSKPTLIWSRSFIGHGSPEQGLSKCHGEPFTSESYKKTREFYRLAHAQPFEVSEGARRAFPQGS